MFLFWVFVHFCVLGQLDGSQLDEHSDELRHAEWECDTVCVGSGGRAAFDSKNKICKCALDKNTDDIEEGLILKDAKLLGIPLVITKDIAKRQANSDPTLGQRYPQRIITPRTILRTTTRRPFRFTSNRAFPTTHRLTTPRINTSVQERLQQIQKRIEDRRRSRARNHPSPHLQQRADFQDESRPNLKERLKQIQNDIEEKQKSRLATSTTAGPNVGAPAPPKANTRHSQLSPVVGKAKETSVKSTDNAVTNNGKNKNFEIITQDPRLYDQDD